MRKPEIIFYYSKAKERELLKEFEHIGQFHTFPLDEPLAGGKFNRNKALIVIYDSSREGKGIHTLKAVRQKFPAQPLVLVVEHPNNEYLVAALASKVSNFFTCPVKKAEVVTAVSSHLQRMKPTFMESLKSWFNHLKSSVMAPSAGTADRLSSEEDLKNLEILALAPPTLLPFLGKEPDQENTYDISVQFFGRLQMKIRGKTVPPMRGKNASILAYLLLHHHKSVHRSALIHRFWGDFSTSSAKNSLNVAIHNIRKVLAKVLEDQEVILFQNGSYCINPQLEIITDVEKFTYYWKKGRAIEASQGLHHALHAYNKAIGFYREEFLEDLRMDDWCDSERANLREIYLFILNRLSAFFLEEQNYYACVNVCKKMLATDECLEEAHRKLMRCYYALGLMDMAFKQFFKCKKILAEELELQPSQLTVDLFEQIQSGAVA